MFLLTLDVKGSNVNVPKLVRTGMDKETNMQARMSIEVFDSINNTFELRQPHTKHMAKELIVSIDVQKETSLEA